MVSEYSPGDKILEKYAKVMVNFGLNNGKGLKKGETVFLVVPENAKPFLKHLYREVLQKGGNPIIHFTPDGMASDIYKYGTDEQISYFPSKLLKGRIDEIDHQLLVLADSDPKELSKIDPKKIMMSQKAMLPYMKWREEKENDGKYSWTLCLYPTLGKAKEAKMSLKEYWKQVIDACYLNESDPVRKWQSLQKQIKITINKLDSLKIDKVHVEAKNTDLWVTIGKSRRWLGGDGANIPSFEIFTSPDWRGTNGVIEFTEPLYRFGNLIEGISLKFKNGLIVEAKARKNEKFLKQLIGVERADRIGEFSMTDRRFSNINKFMAETLFDENVGREFGNTHLAVGNSYSDTYSGDVKKLDKNKLTKLGFNKSAIHCDIVSTSDRTITAYLEDGSQKVIFKKGQFTV